MTRDFFCQVYNVEVHTEDLVLRVVLDKAEHVVQVLFRQLSTEPDKVDLPDHGDNNNNREASQGSA